MKVYLCALIFAVALADVSRDESSCMDHQCTAPQDGAIARSLAQKMRGQSISKGILSEVIDPINGAWNKDDAEHAHVYSVCLSKSINNFAKSREVATAMDLGAGTGHYSAAMIALGVETSCYDGNPDTPAISAHLCESLDLSVKLPSLLQEAPLTPPKPSDFVWSFEVGEHIPSTREATFMDNLASLAAKYLVLSWAVPGQNGNGHVNERDNAYVIQEMGKRGFVYDAEASTILRQESAGPKCCCAWFQNTLMAFNKSSSR